MRRFVFHNITSHEGLRDHHQIQLPAVRQQGLQNCQGADTDRGLQRSRLHIVWSRPQKSRHREASSQGGGETHQGVFGKVSQVAPPLHPADLESALGRARGVPKDSRVLLLEGRPLVGELGRTPSQAAFSSAGAVAACIRRTSHATSGRSSSHRTAPLVRRSMRGQCSAGTRRPLSFHWLTAVLFTPSAVASAFCDPRHFAALSTGWSMAYPENINTRSLVFLEF